MPSKSPKQARLMRAIAHGWEPPASSGIHVPVSVAKEFEAADQRRSHQRHGYVKMKKDAK